MLGRLLVVATPLGNLEDLSPRAVDALRKVACIACEDTRRTARLLARFDVRTPMVSCHEFNERRRIEPIVGRLRRGEDVALVSDGGTPGISDPGADLVRAAREAGITVVPIPGPSALTSLLSVSGLPADRFVFEGFLPSRAGERRRRLRELRSETRTLVFYEAPHRIRATLLDVASILGDRFVILGRELTKIHETVIRGSPAQVLAVLGQTRVLGEITVAIGGRVEGRIPDEGLGGDDPRLARAWREALDASNGNRRTALRRAARELRMDRSELSRRLAEIGLDARDA